MVYIGDGYGKITIKLISYQLTCKNQPAQGFFQGGGGKHLPLLGFGLGLPPLGNFVLKAYQFKCFKIFNSYTMHNKF